MQYAFMTAEDKAKLNTFQQFTDPTVIQPKKIECPKEMPLVKQATGSSAWNHGTTWEDKKLKIDDIKKYLIDQNILIGENADEAQLKLTGFESMSGEASIAVIRTKPRIGYELTFKAILTGVENTYL